MAGAAGVDLWLGVDAERNPLETVARPLSAAAVGVARGTKRSA
jgi:hypothetical protein